MFGQTFDLWDLGTIGLLVLLEAVLSIDNALVLSLLAKRLPPDSQGKALRYGLISAFLFRIIAVVLAAYLLHWRWIRLLGGVYLAGLAIRHFLPKSSRVRREESARRFSEKPASFWWAVVGIELADMAFAVDNILAAIALVGAPPPGTRPGVVHPKLWVIIVGGMLGVILMRFAAQLGIQLLNRFPRFDASAYLIVLLVGSKLIAEFLLNRPGHRRISFESYHDWGFWLFWILMALCLLAGLLPKRRDAQDAEEREELDEAEAVEAQNTSPGKSE